MKEMKTLTINGVTYTVTDPDAASIDDSAVGANAWSSKNIVDKLCPAFSESGAVVTCEPVEGHPLEVVSSIVSTQSGTGTPSPDNVRPVNGYTELQLTRCGNNLFDYTDWIAYCNQAYTANAAKEVEYLGEQCFTYRLYRSNTSKYYTRIKFKPNTQYTFKFNVAFNYNNNESYDIVPVLCVGYGTGDFAYVHASTAYKDKFVEVTFTSAANKTIQSLFIANFSATGIIYIPIDKFVVQEGTTADYASYTGGTFTIDLGQTVYGGTYNWSTGELTISLSSLVLDGSSTGKKVVLTDPGAKTYAYLQFPAGKPSGSCRGDRAYCNLSYGALVITIPKSISGVTDSDTDAQVVSKINAVLKTWYEAGTPLTVVYELATPATVQMAPQQILALSSTNTVFSSTGDTTVTGRSNPTAIINKLTNAIVALGGTV